MVSKTAYVKTLVIESYFSSKREKAGVSSKILISKIEERKKADVRAAAHIAAFFSANLKHRISNITCNNTKY